MKPALRTAQAWARVHPLRPALLLLAASGALSLFGAQAMIDSLGFMLFETPVSLLLLVPTIAGIAVAVGSDTAARLPLPTPKRLLGARLAWVAGLTATAAAVASLGQLIGPAVPWQAGIRNTLLHASLAVLTVTLGYASLAWLPPVGMTLLCMLFGYPPSEPGYYWWAAIMEEQVTITQWTAVCAIFIAVSVSYAAAPALGRHVGKYSNGLRQAG